jgi:hypothetical protein
MIGSGINWYRHEGKRARACIRALNAILYVGIDARYGSDLSLYVSH